MLFFKEIMKTFINEKPQKISKLLASNYGAELSYSNLMKLFRNKDIKVNGKRINKDIIIDVGAVVDVYFDGEIKAYSPVFEGSAIFVFNKPPTITSEDFEALLNKTYKGLKLCHRLDRNTSGLLVFASEENAYNEMLLAFKNRTVDKFYLAEVYGTLAVKKARLTAYLYKDANNSEVKIYDTQVNGSVKIITEYEVVSENENTSLLSVKLITGKTHQIRAHLAHIGHFIVGDGKYGVNKINKTLKQKRQNLKAYKTIFHFDKSSPLKSLDGVEITLPKD